MSEPLPEEEPPSPQPSPEPPAAVAAVAAQQQQGKKKKGSRAKQQPQPAVEEEKVTEVSYESTGASSSAGVASTSGSSGPDLGLVKDAVAEESSTKQTSPAAAAAAGGKKKKKQQQQQQQNAELQSQTVAAAASGKLTSRELLQAVKKTWLDESEAQQLIEVLLNKQAGGGAGDGGSGTRGWVDAGKGQGGEVRRARSYYCSTGLQNCVNLYDLQMRP